MKMLLKALVLVSTVLVAAAPASAGGDDALLAGSYWYAFDNITGIQPGARVVVWVTVPPAWHGQEVELGAIEPEPAALLDDPATGNTVIEWVVQPETFTMLPKEKPRHIFFHYDFRVKSRPVKIDPAAHTGGEYDRDSEIWRRYTRRETLLQTDGDILDKAREITAGVTDPVQRARAVFGWITANFTFVPGGRGERDARSILASGQGDCEQYSLLFVAMCRSLGIPARTVTNVWPNATMHVFAEILTPDGTWLPVDISVAQLMRPDGGGMAPADARDFVQALGLPPGDPAYMFGNLYDRRAVVTVGNNISFTSPAMGRLMTFQRMRPGGDAASPEALEFTGLNEDVVHGGFYVIGDQPAGEKEAHELVHLRLADRFFAAGRYDVAEAGCRASLEAQPDAVKAWLNMGRVYMHKQDYYRAEAAFKRALKGGAGNPQEKLEASIWAHNYLGNCYDLLGHRDMALEQYRTVVEMGNNLKGAVDYARKYLDKPFDMYPAWVGAR